MIIYFCDDKNTLSLYRCSPKSKIWHLNHSYNTIWGTLDLWSHETFPRDKNYTVFSTRLVTSCQHIRIAVCCLWDKGALRAMLQPTPMCQILITDVSRDDNIECSGMCYGGDATYLPAVKHSCMQCQKTGVLFLEHAIDTLNILWQHGIHVSLQLDRSEPYMFYWGDLWRYVRVEWW